MKRYIFIFLFCSLTFGCNHKNKKTESKDLDILGGIDFISEQPDTLFKFEELIAIRKADGYMLEISQLFETPYGYLILDKKNNFLGMFDKTGHFVRQYGSVGGGPDEYQGIQYVFIQGESVYVYSGWDSALYKFNMATGTGMGKLRFPILAHQISPISENELLVYVSNNPTDTHYNVYKTDYHGNILNVYFPFDPKKSNAVTTLTGFLHGRSESIYFSQPFDHQIYSYIPAEDQFKVQYAFDFVSSEMLKDRENFNFFVQTDFLYNPDRKGRLLRELFYKNNNYILLSIQFDTQVIYAVQNLKNQEISMFSKKVNSKFLKMLDKPVLLTENDDLYFPLSPEKTAQGFEINENEMLTLISNAIPEEDEGIVYYLLKVSIN